MEPQAPSADCDREGGGAGLAHPPSIATTSASSSLLAFGAPSAASFQQQQQQTPLPPPNVYSSSSSSSPSIVAASQQQQQQQPLSSLSPPHQTRSSSGSGIPSAAAAARRKLLWAAGPSSFHQSIDDRLQLPGVADGAVGATGMLNGGVGSGSGKRKVLMSATAAAIVAADVLSNSCGSINHQVCTDDISLQGFHSGSAVIPRRRAAFCCGETSRPHTAHAASTNATFQQAVASFAAMPSQHQQAQPPCGAHNPLTCGGGGQGTCCVGGVPRPPQLGVRSPQTSFDSNGDVGQISLNWMRMNGAIAPFKILNSDYGSNSSATTTPTVSAPYAGGGGGGSGATATPRLSGPPSADCRDFNASSSLGGLNGAFTAFEGSCHRLAAVTAAATTSPCVVDYVRRKDSFIGSAGTPQRPLTPPLTFHHNHHHAAMPPSGIAAHPSSSLCVALARDGSETMSRKASMGNALNMTVTIDGERHSKRSISLVSASDVEMQRVHEDARLPLMRDKEKGGRLIRRQFLFYERRVTSDFALLFSIIGIALMVIENELCASHFYVRSSWLRITLRLMIFFSTLVLIGLVIKFHVHEVQLFMNANSVADWWIAMTPHQCIQLSIEILVCGICPLPVDFSFDWVTAYDDGRPAVVTRVPVDVLLSIPMFFRLYWVWRVMLLHSRLFTDNCNRSIAGLNRVNLNSRFILKILMTLCPGTMLMVFTASLWIIAGWILRLCERHYDGDPINAQSLKHQNYLNSLWLIAITFLSVGYGDIVPNTYCGRVVAVVAGILGTGTSSMVVAVIARKLELTRAEKHVHNFMMDTQLTKQLKHSAANVLRETWLIYKYRRLVEKVDKDKVRHHQRKFLVAIYALRKVKRDQRKLNENSVSLGDVAKTTSNSYELVRDIYSTQEGLSLRVTSVEHQLSDIQRELSDLSSLLRQVLRQSSVASITDADDQQPPPDAGNSSLRRRNNAAVSGRTVAGTKALNNNNNTSSSGGAKTVAESS